MTIRQTFLSSLFGLSKNAAGGTAGSATGTSCVGAANTSRRGRFRPATVAAAALQSARPGPRRVRIRKIPPSSRERPLRPTVPKLPPAGPSLLPKPLKPALGGISTGLAASNGAQSFSGRTVRDFLKLNGPVLLLNFGSCMTLAGFLCTDVLELRIGNLIGNCCGMTYFLINRLYPPLTWASIFGATNAYNISLILSERSDKVTMTKAEQALYEEHFLTHGVTPNQFHMIMEKSEVIRVPKDQVIVRANTPLDSVYLVTSGRTEASILGRHLTYASSLPGNNVRQKGGDSGAWIGEVPFLENFWKKEQPQRRHTKSPVEFLSKQRDNVEEGNDETDMDDEEEDFDIDGYYGGRDGRALYTIVCTEDATLRRWKHSDLEDVLKLSTDMRSAMTRALTAGVVGKVVNFTISRGRERELGEGGSPTWSIWLQDGATTNETNVHAPRKITDAADAKQIADNKKKQDKEIPKRLPPRNKNTTREDAIEAFRQILLVEPGIGRA